ncbi:MAG TPA: histidine kinase [Dongiaceae bacterium]|nr:histidine kinase [Dongiaceae bacterium]
MPRSDLKYRLTLRIAAISAFCFAATLAYVLYDTNRAARAGIETVADIVARDLELQRSKMDWVKNQAAAFPDLQNIATPLMAPGLCIAYRAETGDILQRFCSGTEGDYVDPPAAFTALYGKLFDPGRGVVRPVLFRDRQVGQAVVWADPVTLTTRAWREAGHLATIMAATLLLLCGLVYAALARALRPTQLIRAGLERIAANDLSARLPAFDLAELSAIRNVFNHLADSLERALAERRELTRRLIALQDEERQHLARELHDEFGQCLAAIRALAASAGQTAAQDCPSLLSECESIARTASHMMEMLRGTLFRLRPPDVDELGLAASLEGLIAGWNSRSRGRTRFEISLCGEFEHLPPAFGAALYRVAQEAITNAAKHAEATRVVLHLTAREGMEIELTVDDDGKASGHDEAPKSGMGFLGMRERVATLGGKLNFVAGRKTGSVLRVLIPAVPNGDTAAVRSVKHE